MAVEVTAPGALEAVKVQFTVPVPVTVAILVIGTNPAPDGRLVKLVIAAPDTLLTVVICANLVSAIEAPEAILALVMFPL